MAKQQIDNRTAREQELLAIARAKGDEATARCLCEDIAFLEERLSVLRKLPHLKVDPKNPERQKATPAARQYKEMLQQYNNSLKLFAKICGALDEEEVESPLRAWLNQRRTG